VEQNFLEAAYGHARVILTCHPHNPHITEPMHERAAASATYKRPLSSICTENRVKPQSGYPLKVGQLEYDCRYSTMHGMPVTGGRGFRSLKPLWYKGVPP
jgi:hypothetical protein